VLLRLLLLQFDMCSCQEVQQLLCSVRLLLQRLPKPLHVHPLLLLLLQVAFAARAVVHSDALSPGRHGAQACTSITAYTTTRSTDASTP
jgi:hypothetical protein